MYLATGSSSFSLPSSTSIIAATLVIGLLIEYRRKMVSSVIGSLGREIAHAEEFVIDRLAMLLDQQNGARDFAVGDLAAEKFADRAAVFAD